MTPPNQSTPPLTTPPIMPLIVRNAIRREARKEGIPSTEMARSLLYGTDCLGCAPEDKTSTPAVPPGSETAPAADPDGRIQVALIIRPERLTLEQLGKLTETVFQRGPDGNDFIQKLIAAKSPPQEDAKGAESEWSDPAPAVKLGPWLTGAELAEFNTRCWFQGKTPENVLAALIKREIANDTEAGTVPPAP